MEARTFWRPTKAASKRMAELGIQPERREAPYATMYYGAELPDEFVVVRFGTPAEEAQIGLASEPVGIVMAKAAEIAAERLSMRPGCGSPDGMISHDEDVAIDALMFLGHSQPVYKGERLPWWHHEMFAPARAAAWRAALQR